MSIEVLRTGPGFQALAVSQVFPVLGMVRDVLPEPCPSSERPSPLYSFVLSYSFNEYSWGL